MAINRKDRIEIQGMIDRSLDARLAPKDGEQPPEPEPAPTRAPEPPAPKAPTEEPAPSKKKS